MTTNIDQSLELLSCFNKKNYNIENFQNESENDVCIDYNNIILNKCIKYLLNFVITYLILYCIFTNFKNLTLIQFILVICTISSVLLYILDLTFPICNIA